MSQSIKTEYKHFIPNSALSINYRLISLHYPAVPVQNTLGAVSWADEKNYLYSGTFHGSDIATDASESSSANSESTSAASNLSSASFESSSVCSVSIPSASFFFRQMRQNSERISWGIEMIWWAPNGKYLSHTILNLVNLVRITR